MLRFHNFLGHTYCETLFDGTKPPTVVDCGSNRGEFAKHCAVRHGARVFSYEANPDLAAGLPELPGVTFVNAAVTGRPGSIEVHRAPGMCSSVRFHESETGGSAIVEGVTLEQIMTGNGIQRVDLLKLDIEGAELDVLERSSSEILSRCTQITCEFHDFIDRGDLPRIRGILENLRSTFVIVSLSVFNYGDVLFLNRAALAGRPLASAEVLVHKYTAGLARMLRRATRMSR
jgi:FkbM family methyltransferase